MPAALEQFAKPVIVGRSSSHFTRVTRIFAAELRVDCSFEVVRDLQSPNAADYAGNPALKLPVLRTSAGTWFGALNICRELSRHSSLTPQRIVWPEDLDQPLLANTQELVVQAMATEATLIMAKRMGGSDASDHQAKMRKSLLNTLSWLEQNAKHALAALPADRALSYLEVTLLCLVTHLEFVHLLPSASYPELNGFCQHFAARPSVNTTSFHFDA